MTHKKNFKVFRYFNFYLRKSLAVILFVSGSSFISSCGNSDAEPRVKKFCTQVKIGEPVMNVVARAEKADFDKYWLEKFDKDPSKGENIGIVRPRDLKRKTEKLNILKDPKRWKHGQFRAMIQELGYSRHVCSVDFSRDKVLRKKVFSVN